MVTKHLRYVCRYCGKLWATRAPERLFFRTEWCTCEESRKERLEKVRAYND